MNKAISALMLVLVVGSLSCFGIRTLPLQNAFRGETFDSEGEYRLGPLDEIYISVQGQVELTGNYAVTSAGTLSFPLIGFTKVQGLTVSQLGRQLENELGPFVKKPKVSLHTVNRKSYRVHFVGEINRPGSVSFEDKTNLLQGIATVGSLTRFASGRVVIIRAQKDGAKERYGIDYDALVRGEGVSDRFVLERGDIIVVE